MVKQYEQYLLNIYYRKKPHFYIILIIFLLPCILRSKDIHDTNSLYMQPAAGNLPLLAVVSNR